MSDVKLRLVTEEEDRLAALDEDLASLLATSVERAATLKAFDEAIIAHEGDYHPEKQHIRRALRELRRAIEKGRHVR